RHDLDALRAFAMLLGIALHAALSFMEVPWLVHDRSQHWALALFVVLVHVFRMPLFFLLSGFFTAMLWRRRGLAELLTHRARRVLLPFVLAMATIGPLMLWIAHLAESRGVAVHGWWGWLAEFPVFAHLWFLWFLCWLVVAFALAVRVGRALGLSAPPRWVTVSPLAWCWIVPVTLVPQWWMHDGGLTVGFGAELSAGVIPIPHVFAFYAVFFFFGAAYFLADDSEGRLGRWWWAQLGAAVCVVFPFALGYGLHAPELPAFGSPVARHAVAAVLEVVCTWLLVIGSLGLCRRLLFARERPWVRYISDSSYWLYLAHLPLVVAGQLVVRDWTAPAVAKFALLLAVCTPLLLASYHWGVRYTWIGRLLNGPRVRPAADSVAAGTPATLPAAVRPAQQEAT
ncbi:MAG: acyltransferase family protein, partial [Planctomycetota bacterium]